MAVLGRTIILHTTNSNSKALTVQKSFFLVSAPSNPLLLTSRYPQNPNSPFPLRLRRRFALPSRPYPGRCLAAKPGHPPPSPESEPDPDSPRPDGFEGSLSKFQDRMQIFFAVLFWMSLFFWTCAWDDRNRPNKGSRFRR